MFRSQCGFDMNQAQWNFIDRYFGDRLVHSDTVIEPDVHGTRQFFDLLAAHSEFESTAIQTVGTKGWGGFSISLLPR